MTEPSWYVAPAWRPARRFRIAAWLRKLDRRDPLRHYKPVGYVDDPMWIAPKPTQPTFPRLLFVRCRECSHAETGTAEEWDDIVARLAAHACSRASRP